MYWLPAISAALIAPIEMPATQSGVWPHRRERSRRRPPGRLRARRCPAGRGCIPLGRARACPAGARPRLFGPEAARRRGLRCHQCLFWRQLGRCGRAGAASSGQTRAPGAVLSDGHALLLRARRGDRRPGSRAARLAPSVVAAGLRSCTAQVVSKEVHRLECRRDGRADGQQAVAAQHQEGLGAEVGDQARLLLVAQGGRHRSLVAEAGQPRRGSRTARSAAGPRRRDGDCPVSGCVGVHHVLAASGMAHGALLCGSRSRPGGPPSCLFPAPLAFLVEVTLLEAFYIRRTSSHKG